MKTDASEKKPLKLQKKGLGALIALVVGTTAIVGYHKDDIKELFDKDSIENDIDDYNKNNLESNKDNSNNKFDKSESDDKEIEEENEHSIFGIKSTIEKSKSDSEQHENSIINNNSSKYPDQNSNLNDKPNQSDKHDNSVHTHKWKVTKTSYKSNNDSTHLLTITEKCSECEQTKSTSQTQQCKYGTWNSNGEQGEIRECSLCHNKETRKHSFSQQETGWKHIDGTHQHAMGVINKCKNCDYEFKSTKNKEDCDLNGTVKTSTDLNVTIDCSKCNNPTLVHTHVPDTHYEQSPTNADCCLAITTCADLNCMYSYRVEVEVPHVQNPTPHDVTNRLTGKITRSWLCQNCNKVIRTEIIEAMRTFGAETIENDKVKIKTLFRKY